MKFVELECCCQIPFATDKDDAWQRLYSKHAKDEAEECDLVQSYFRMACHSQLDEQGQQAHDCGIQRRRRGNCCMCSPLNLLEEEEWHGCHAPPVKHRGDNELPV